MDEPDSLAHEGEESDLARRLGDGRQPPVHP